MTLSELSIRRFALALMLNAVIVLFGVVSLDQIGVNRFPNVEAPVVSVMTVLPGANPEIIDSSVTGIIESAVNSVSGIDFVQATSSPSVSLVFVIFELGKDVDTAFTEIQSKVNQVMTKLPDSIQTPVIQKIEIGAAPIMWISIQGDRTKQQLIQYSLNNVKKRLENIEGVGSIMQGGEQRRTIRVEVDLTRMAALGLTVQDVRRALASEHVQMPGGFMVGKDREYLIKLDQEYHNPRHLQELVIGYRQGAPIMLQDVANVVDGMTDVRAAAFYNGEINAGLGVVKISDANAVQVAADVKKRLQEEIIPQLPPGITAKIATDDTIFIGELIKTLYGHIILGTLLAALVVLIFLQDIRATLIVGMAIPVSLFGAVATMYFGGFTFNTFSLLALLLLIGVVVDDAIVVLENIHRHMTTIENDPIESSINGANEVFFAVLAASLALVCIFGPVIFMGGMIGVFFKSFTVVVTVGVLVSFFVAITLTPMLCSRFLKPTHKKGAIASFVESGIVKTEDWYKSLLDTSLNYRWIVIILAGLVVSTSGFFLDNLGKGFNPKMDESRFMVYFKTPIGSTVEYTEAKLRDIQAALDKHPEIVGHFSGVALMPGSQPSSGIAFVIMKQKHERERPQDAIMAEVQRDLANIPGVRAFAGRVPPIGAGRGEPLQFNVAGPDLYKVAELSADLEKQLSQYPELGPIDLDLQIDMPQVELTVDRLRAASLGLSASDVSLAINSLMGGSDIAYYNDYPGDGERYRIRLKAQEGQIGKPEDLKKIFLRSRSGELVRADTIAEFRETVGPAKITKYNLQYSADFYVNPDISLGEAIEIVEKETQNLPLGYRLNLGGQAKSLGDTAIAVLFAIGMGLILLYMVLASQFNKFLQPLVIMLAQPLAVVGGLAFLWLFDKDLILYSMIGMILLMGLVAKNSILLVDLTNQYRENGMSIDEALRAACPIRMRPVVMTSLTLILAMLPAAMGRGAGAESNSALAITIIGGMISSTLLTLVVVPAMYSLLENFLLRFENKTEDAWETETVK